MRVLYVTSAVTPFQTEQRESLEERGIEIDVIEAFDGPRSPVRDRFELLPEVRAKAGEYDVIHALDGHIGPVCFAQSATPVVLSLIGSDSTGPWGRFNVAASRFADAVVPVNDEIASRVPNDTVSVIPFGVDLELFSPMDQATAQERVGWDGDKRRVLFPYDPDRTVKDFDRARSVTTDAAGRIDEDVALHVVHDKPFDMIPVYMNAADVLAFTSKREGAPNTVKEALACNLPIVSTDVGDVSMVLDQVDRAVVSDNDEELAAGMARILAEDERCAGRSVAEQWCWEEVAGEYAAVYEDLQ